MTFPLAFRDKKSVPARPVTLGTDGYGSDTRENLRRFFEMDRHHIAVAALAALAEENKIKKEIVAEAIRRYGITSDVAPPWER